MTGRPVVTTLRTDAREAPVVLAEGGTWTVRAQVHEAWDAIACRVAPDTPVAVVKAEAIARLLQGTADPGDYVVKVGGTEVRDESRGLAASGVRDRGTLFLHARRRRPVR